MMKILVIFSILLFSPVVLAAECTQAEAIDAEKTVLNLESWEELEIHFSNYNHCDDGGIAEGYSESVSFLLANRWQEFLIFEMDPVFFNFVNNHIDETWKISRFNQVLDQVRANCNKSKEAICINVLGMDFGDL